MERQWMDCKNAELTWERAAGWAVLFSDWGLPEVDATKQANKVIATNLRLNEATVSSNLNEKRMKRITQIPSSAK
jgi:hypothetical protein